MKHIILEGDTVTVEVIPELTLVDNDEPTYDPRNSAVHLPVLTEEKIRELEKK